MSTSDAQSRIADAIHSSSGQDAKRKERIPVRIFENASDLSCQVAERIRDLIEERASTGRPCVLGLPTGSTPLGVYEHLIKMHTQGLDFSGVIAFNLDEYYPMDPGSIQSYHRFMAENFFNHVNIQEQNIHIPRGDVAPDEFESFCESYEQKIVDCGGLDLVLLGIGRSGHIGFNEPGSGPDTRTRAIILDEITIKDAASDFFGEENVPRQAITMGVGTILDAREVILMATGEHKAPIIRRAVEEKPTREVTATYLQKHARASFYVDVPASGELTRIKTPWVVSNVRWDESLAKRAVIWLSHTVEKAIMRLEKGDFHQHYLHSLTSAYPETDELCLSVFEDLRRRIAYRDDVISGKKVILFSPHPDDDVISMGGMLDRLVTNGNEVTVAYMTNGSVAVFDADVRRYLRFLEMTGRVFDLGSGIESRVRSSVATIRSFLEAKSPGEVDSEEVQELKAYIRYAEAISGIEVMGMTRDDARFLDMPFYKTGRVRKDPIGPADTGIVLDLLKELAPEHIFVAGDLSDPHGTHRMCYSAISKALAAYSAIESEQHQDPLIWLYRGAWQEWEIDRTDVFIPLSKADLDRKIEAIFKHESQKDRAMFPGAYDSREFWERARDRNCDTAAELNRLGLPEFYAVEAYVIAQSL